MKDYVILIPAYNPSKKLIKLVEDLKEYKCQILIINDGSINCRKIFTKLKAYKYCIVLEYPENRGKGYAMKYGIKYYLDNFKDNYKGIITVDADYQHIPSDIEKVALNMDIEKITLGSRDFTQKDIPIINKLGNRITSVIFKLLYGYRIDDTQTGLRGIPNKYLDICLEIEGKRFEYEMEELIYFVNHKIDVEEINIKTVYYSKSESKFHKVIDSLKIYKVILKESFRFLVTSLVSSLLDINLFTIFLNVFSNLGDLAVIFSTFIARIIADFMNFNLTKYFVFDSNEESKSILVKYYLLGFVKMIMSAVFVILISKVIFISKTLIKIVVDIVLYFFNYRIQKKYIFKTIDE